MSGPLDARRDLLAAVLDTLVPSAGAFPGAGAVAMGHVLAMTAASPDLAAALSRALDAVEAAAGAGAFAALAPDVREAALRGVEAAHPEWFEALVRQTYDGYYSHPEVVERLGLDPRPPQPRGHRIEPADLPDLDRVRARGPIYRKA